MPKYYTGTAQQVEDTLSGAKTARLHGRIAGGSVVLAQASYTMTGTEAINDTINICHLPAGAVVIPHLSMVCHESLGDALSMSFGTQLKSTAFSMALDFKENGKTGFIGGTSELNPIGSESEWIVATMTSVNAPLENKKMQFWIAYVMP